MCKADLRPKKGDLVPKATRYNVGNKQVVIVGIRAIDTRGVVALFERKDVRPYS